MGCNAWKKFFAEVFFVTGSRETFRGFLGFSVSVSLSLSLSQLRLLTLTPKRYKTMHVFFIWLEKAYICNVSHFPERACARNAEPANVSDILSRDILLRLVVSLYGNMKERLAK